MVGFNFDGIIRNSYATGSVNGTDFLGGLIGSNYGTITNSYATGSVNGDSDVGGLVGYNRYGTITNSYATGSVTGTIKVGGLMGINDYGTITNSYATGTANGNDNVGGLVGFNTYDGIITNSFYDKTKNKNNCSFSHKKIRSNANSTGIKYERDFRWCGLKQKRINNGTNKTFNTHILTRANVSNKS